jgi:hypothetical protein
VGGDEKELRKRKSHREVLDEIPRSPRTAPRTALCSKCPSDSLETLGTGELSVDEQGQMRDSGVRSPFEAVE